MAAVDMIFSWGFNIITVFSAICEWFVTPLSTDVIGVWLSSYFGLIGSFVGWMVAVFEDFTGLFGVTEITPIWIIMGPGLVIFLAATVIRWAIDLIPLL